MPVVTRRELLEAGVHFGHQTRRWNPKMRRFIFGERAGIYIIDLETSLAGIERAYDFLQGVGRRGGSVLFVGTKKQAQEVVAQQAARVGMPYVNTRWLGGMLTNFRTIYRRLQDLKDLREMERSGMMEYLPKKEAIRLRHDKAKLERNLSGLQDMERVPDALFVIDTKKEHIAIKEARKLGIPIIGVIDTNADPDEVDYPIPGNDDAIRSCALITRVVADGLQEGQYLAYQQMQTRAEPEFEEEPAAEPEAAAGDAEEDRPRVQLSAEEAAWMGANVEDDGAAADGTSGAAAPADGDGAETDAAAGTQPASVPGGTDEQPGAEATTEPAGAEQGADA
jgi:small subunit ribosomal protein S2